MGGFIRSNAERVKTKQISAKIDKEVCDDFKDYCKIFGYPINIMIEIFMKQFVDGKFVIECDKNNKRDNNVEEKTVINTTVNLEVYNEFKSYCKENGYFVNAIFTAFMKQFIEEDYVLEFKKVEK